MEIKIPKGKYVVAVSGGVDSMTLLNILAKERGLELIVAHFNHGIRPDSDEDEELVRQTAKHYKLPLEVGYGKLGPSASEEQARKSRYAFLNRAKNKHRAKAIITAHHQDDLIETAIINLLRGTGRRGLTSIAQNPQVVRPLLRLSKKNIENYAKINRLQWQEDPTNKDERYLRNFVRRRIVSRLSDTQRHQLLQKVQKLKTINQLLNQEIAKMSQNLVNDTVINRPNFTALPAEVAQEILMHFLRDHHISGFDKKTIERLVVNIKTAKPGTKHDVINGASLKLTALEAVLSTTD